jgi:hypothetical protein
MKIQTLQKILVSLLVVSCLTNGVDWAHKRFYIYRSQGWLLAPADYHAQVIPVTSGVPDYRQAEARKSAAEFHKTLDGQYYVRVITLGTAHYIDRVTGNFIIPFVLALAVSIVWVWTRLKRSRKPDHQDETGQ